MSDRTLYAMLVDTVARFAANPAIGWRVDKNAPISYITYSELLEKVKQLRASFYSMGLRPGDKIAIIAENRPEWAIADLAAHSLGLVVVSPYASLPPAQAGFILRDSGARLAICSDAKQVKKLDEVRASCPNLQWLVQMEGQVDATRDDIRHFDDLLETGENTPATSELDEISASIDPASTALLIYTSGTTGEPKGAMLCHRSMLQTPDAVVDEPIADIGSSDEFLSFLPLSHITERVGGLYLPLRVGACIVYSLGLAQLGTELTQVVRPTCMLCVPRLLENIHEKFLDSLGKMDASQRSKVEWALQVGNAYAAARFSGNSPGLFTALQRKVADRLILQKVREKVTGGRLRFVVSGGAPLHKDTALFFLAIGIQILEGYGLSETSIIAINRPDRQRIGTVGNLLSDVELKIAEDGELLMRGLGRMQGYFNRPEETTSAIDPQGWFHTGDIGELSQDGYLRITDRKKDLIVLTNGKKVAPQPLEAMLKESQLISEAVLFGDGQSTIMALIVPEFGRALEVGRQKDPGLKDIASFVGSEEFNKLIRAEVDRVNGTLADYEKIKRFKVLDKPFSIDGGELTPTLKVKRRFVAEKYAEAIASMSR